MKPTDTTSPVDHTAGEDAAFNAGIEAAIAVMERGLVSYGELSIPAMAQAMRAKKRVVLVLSAGHVMTSALHGGT